MGIGYWRCYLQVWSIQECVLASTSRNSPDYFSVNDLDEAKVFLQKASSFLGIKIFHLEASIWNPHAAVLTVW